MASDRSKIDFAKSFLRREHAAEADAGLAYFQQLARDTFASAVDEVAITSTGFEGGSASGQLKFEKVLLGIALEELLNEIAVVPVVNSRTIFSDFSTNFIRT